jgi:hypothetical protein
VLEDRRLPGDTVLGLAVVGRGILAPDLLSREPHLDATTTLAAPMAQEHWSDLDLSSLTIASSDGAVHSVAGENQVPPLDTGRTETPSSGSHEAGVDPWNLAANLLAPAGRHTSPGVVSAAAMTGTDLTGGAAPSTAPTSGSLNWVAAGLATLTPSPSTPALPFLPASSGGTAAASTPHRLAAPTVAPGGVCSGTVAPPTDDWPTYQHDVAHTGQSPAAIDPSALSRAWQAPTGYATPLVVGSNVIAMKNQQGIGNDRTLVTSFNLADGSVNWTYSNQFVFPSQPTTAEGLVVFAASSNSTPLTLYALDVNSGSLLYTVPLSGGPIAVMPTIARNPETGGLTAYVATGGNLFAVDLESDSGSVLWTQTGSFGGFSMPTVVGNSVILAGPGQFYAFDQTTGQANHFHQGDISGGGGTTVAYDQNLGQFYVLETYDSHVGGALSAYQYVDNNTINLLWQKTDGIRGDSSVAIGPDDLIYADSNTQITEIDPTDGSTVRSLSGQSIANQVTPALTSGYVWAFSDTQTLIYDLSTFTLARTLPGSRGSLNNAYRSPGAFTDGYFLLDHGTIYNSPGFEVYAAPSPPVANDWPTYQHDVAHTGCTPASVDPAALGLAWRAPVGYSTPLVVGGNVIAMKNQQGIGNDRTLVTSFNLADGSVNWTYSNQFVFPSQPTTAEGLVVFAAATNSTPLTLYALDVNSGNLLYTVPLGGGPIAVMPTIARSPETGGLTAYVATGGDLFAVDLEPDSGSVLWTQTGSFGGFSMPTVVGNSVILAGPGQFYAFDQTTGAMNHFHQGDISGGGGVTIAYDQNLGQFYVLETYGSSQFNVLTAYAYVDNDDIEQLWQKTGPGIRTGGSVAIGQDDSVYAVDNTTLVEIDPSDGSTRRSLSGQSIANAVTPEIGNGYLWAFSESQTLIYDLNTFTLAGSLPGARGSLNSAYNSPGALTDGYFLLDYGTIYNRPGLDVFADM